MLNNPPQPEDGDICEEPNASVAKDAAPRVDDSMLMSAIGADESMGADLPETGDSEDSNPFRVKRSRPSEVDDLDALSDAASPAALSTEPSLPAAAPKRSRLGRLMRPRAVCGG